MILTLVFSVVFLIVFLNSALIIGTNTNSYNLLKEKYPIVTIAYGLTMLSLFFALFQVGMIYRSEISVLPWEVWYQESNRHGYESGVLSVLWSLVTLVWMFILPGHLYSNKVAVKEGVRPRYPYILNILVGLILSESSNTIMTALGFLFSSG